MAAFANTFTLAAIMKTFILNIAILLACICKTLGQTEAAFECPIVHVSVKLAADTFKIGEDISVKIMLTNNTKSVQSVWFDKPKSRTGGPAWTLVTLTNKKTGQSVLKHQNKAVLESQLYSTEEVKHYSYKLKPGEAVSGRFSLFDLIVLLDYKQTLAKGLYEIQFFYCNNPSSKFSLTVD